MLDTRLDSERYYIALSDIAAILNVQDLQFKDLSQLIDLGFIDMDLPGSLHPTVDLGIGLEELQDAIQIEKYVKPHPTKEGWTQKFYTAIKTEEQAMAAVAKKTERDRKDNIAKYRGETKPREDLERGEVLGAYRFNVDHVYRSFKRKERDTSDHTTSVKVLEYEPGRRFVGRCKGYKDYVFILTVETLKDPEGRDIADKYSLVGKPARDFHRRGRIPFDGHEDYLAKIEQGLLALSERTTTLASYALDIVDELKRRNALFDREGNVRSALIEDVLAEAKSVYKVFVPKDTKKINRVPPETQFTPVYSVNTLPLGLYMISQLDGTTQRTASNEPKLDEMTDCVRYVIYNSIGRPLPPSSSGASGQAL